MPNTRAQRRSLTHNGTHEHPTWGHRRPHRPRTAHTHGGNPGLGPGALRETPRRHRDFRLPAVRLRHGRHRGRPAVHVHAERGRRTRDQRVRGGPGRRRPRHRRRDRGDRCRAPVGPQRAAAQHPAARRRVHRRHDRMHRRAQHLGAVPVPFRSRPGGRWRLGDRADLPVGVRAHAHARRPGGARPVHDRVRPAPRLLDERGALPRARRAARPRERRPVGHAHARAVVLVGRGFPRRDRCRHRGRRVGVAVDAGARHDPRCAPVGRDAPHARVGPLVRVESSLLRGRGRPQAHP